MVWTAVTSRPPLKSERSELPYSVVRRAKINPVGQFSLGDNIGHIAGMNRVHEGQPLCALNDTQHKLTRDTPGFLVHPMQSEIVFQSSFTMNAYRREIVEDHG